MDETHPIRILARALVAGSPDAARALADELLAGLGGAAGGLPDAGRAWRLDSVETAVAELRGKTAHLPPVPPSAHSMIGRRVRVGPGVRPLAGDLGSTDPLREGLVVDALANRYAVLVVLADGRVVVVDANFTTPIGYL